MIQLITNELSWFWPRFSAAGRATQERVCFGAHSFKMNTNIPISLGLWGISFQNGIQRHNQGFKLFPELV